MKRPQLRAAPIGALAAASMLVTSSVRADEPVMEEPAAEEPVAITPLAQKEVPSNAHLSGRVEATAALRQVFDIPVYGGEVAGSLGTATPDFAAYVDARASVGRTPNGVTMSTYELGGTVEGILGRFRLGMGAAFAELIVTRATPAGAIAALGVRVSGKASFDIARVGSGWLYVRAEISAVAFHGNEASVLWGPSLGAGMRF